MAHQIISDSPILPVSDSVFSWQPKKDTSLKWGRKSKAGISGVLGHALDSELIENNPAALRLKIKSTKKGRLDKALMVTQKKRALKQGRQVAAWVFANEKGRMMCREWFRRCLDKCLEKAGLRRIRVHDLRHGLASIRLNRGHNIADVSRQLGHSSISITHHIYGHLIPGSFKNEVDELDQAQQSATYTQPENDTCQNL